MPSKSVVDNTLFYGDNLPILREYVPDESVDLIYLDPPFNSNRSYNVLFRDESGQEAEAQITAFDDSWHWGPSTERLYKELVEHSAERVARVMGALRGLVGPNQIGAYLVMMTARLVELHRVLKPTGSLYLHCDPTASHYLKIVLDAVFGVENYRNEIVWKRTFAHGNVGRNYGSITDIIFWYTKTGAYAWKQPFTPLDPEYVEKYYRHQDADGRRWRTVTLRNPGPRPNLHYLYAALNGVTYQPHPNGWTWTYERMRQADEEGRLVYPSSPTGALMYKQYLDTSAGARTSNIWDDIPPIGAQAAERLVP